MVCALQHQVNDFVAVFWSRFYLFSSSYMCCAVPHPPGPPEVQSCPRAAPSSLGALCCSHDHVFLQKSLPGPWQVLMYVGENWGSTAPGFMLLGSSACLCSSIAPALNFYAYVYAD